MIYDFHCRMILFKVTCLGSFFVHETLKKDVETCHMSLRHNTETGCYSKLLCRGGHHESTSKEI